MTRRDNLKPTTPENANGRVRISGLGAVAGDALVMICSYVEVKDIVRLTRGVGEDCLPRLRFAEESLRREDSLLRQQEEARRLERASARMKQHTNRTGALRDLTLAKKANAAERMAMVDMKSAVERHSYAPGRRPKIPQASSRRQGATEGTEGGKPMIRRRNPAPSLEGLFCDD
eukprot:jgi/Undpi1/9394/HiC_scaffold_27.g11851.m1